MGIKDVIYLGLIALSAIIFYLHGLYGARPARRRPRKLDVPFNDSGCLTELDDVPAEHNRLTGLHSLTPTEIRAYFGNN